jgi:hypothetical protein
MKKNEDVVVGRIVKYVDVIDEGDDRLMMVVEWVDRERCGVRLLVDGGMLDVRRSVGVDKVVVMEDDVEVVWVGK